VSDKEDHKVIWLEPKDHQYGAALDDSFESEDEAIERYKKLRDRGE